MQQLVIIGNSSAGRETYEVFVDGLAHAAAQAMSFKGFLSHMGYAGNLGGLQHLLLGSDEDYAIAPQDRFVVAIADPALRSAAHIMLRQRGAQFCNIISKRAYVSPDAVLGEGNILGMGCTVTSGVRMGHGNYCNGACKIGHDVTLGDFNFLGPGVSILGSCTVGSKNRFGVNSVLMDKCSVGDENIFAPASVIYKGCKSHKRMTGNPAYCI